MSDCPQAHSHLSITRRANARGIKARVSHEGIRVTAPLRTPATTIDLFVQTHWEYLQRTYEKLSRNTHHISFEPGSHLPYLGQWYELHLSSNACLGGSLGIRNQQLVVIPPIGKPLELEAAIRHWYRQQARKHLYSRCSYHASIMGVSYSAIRIKSQSTRWGSCSSQNNLNFNWKLITMPLHVIDYIVIHELAHLVHLNHGPDFWKLVHQHCPHVEEAKAYLKNYQVVM